MPKYLGEFEATLLRLSYVMETKDAQALIKAGINITSPYDALMKLEGVIDVPSWVDHNPTVVVDIDPEYFNTKTRNAIAKTIDSIIKEAHDFLSTHP